MTVAVILATKLFLPKAPDLSLLGFDHGKQVLHSYPRKTYQHLSDLNSHTWVDRHGFGHGLGCMTNDGKDVITSGLEFWSLADGNNMKNGSLYSLVTKLKPLTFRAATESQQKHMSAFGSEIERGADGRGKHERSIGPFIKISRDRWIAFLPYADADNQSRMLLVATIYADRRGQHPNVEFVVPLAGAFYSGFDKRAFGFTVRTARFDNQGRVIFDAWARVDKSCQHRWYVLDLKTKKARELTELRRTVAVPGAYDEVNDKYRSYVRPFNRRDPTTLEDIVEYDPNTGKKVYFSFKGGGSTGRYMYWRGMLLFEPLGEGKVRFPNGDTAGYSKSKGIHLVSNDRKSLTKLGDYTIMATSGNEKYMLVRQLSDESVHLLTWDKPPARKRP